LARPGTSTTPPTAVFCPRELRERLRFLNSFFFYCSADHRALHSFPTRRSSDLAPASWWSPTWCSTSSSTARSTANSNSPYSNSRSEEHTSELQSRSDLVCRLLLEKKKHETRARASEPCGLMR